MKKFTTLLFFAFFALAGMAQRPTMELSFTAENEGHYVPLDSIFIENLTQGGVTTLYAPDTVLVLDYTTSIGNRITINENTFSVSQNHPNPFYEKTDFHLNLPEKENITITVRDILGRELAHYENTLSRGNHTFTFYPSNERYYLLTVSGNQTSKTIKMLNANNNTPNGGKCDMVYYGFRNNEMAYKSQKAMNDFAFTLGDELRYTGYAKTINVVNGSDVIEDTPQTNKFYAFEITEGIPCPGNPTVIYEGQTYNTLLIGNQCWFKENLNIGDMIPGSDDMEDNGTIEKYCYDNNPANCDIYGGLYLWDEMMKYNTQQGTQGICPD